MGRMVVKWNRVYESEERKRRHSWEFFLMSMSLAVMIRLLLMKQINGRTNPDNSLARAR
jgi:hypothetical protein